MTKIDQMRAAVAQGKQAAKPIIESVRKELAKVDVSKPTKKAAEPKLMVKHRCGHELPVSYFAGCDCGACRQKKIQEKIAKRKAARAAGEGKDTARHTSKEGRLPDGAMFDVKYDAATFTWTGRLVIPGTESRPEGMVFVESAGGVFKLLSALDTRYRQHKV